MKYYHESKDRFDPTLRSKYIDIINSTACQIFGADEGTKSAFLSNIVSQGIHQWRFKFVSTRKRRPGYGTMYIGILNNKIDATKYLNSLCYPHEWAPSQLTGTAYGVNISRGQLRGDKKREKQKYCEPCNNDDIIDMYLDFKSMELRYCVNGKDYGKAFDIKDGSWRASVTFFFTEDKLTLLYYRNNSK